MRKGKNWLATSGKQVNTNIYHKAGTNMNGEKIEILLERIAFALERIADAMEHPKNGEKEFPHCGETKGDALKSSTTELNDAPSVLESFLTTKGIRIKTLPPNDAADHVIDSLSLFLGERYDALASILSKIKRAMPNGAPIVENLKDRPQQDVSSVCQFCTRLHEIAFLEQYQYFRSPIYLIKAKTTTLPKAQRFFGGQWLERFILQKVKSVKDQVMSEITDVLPFEYLINPQIVLPNGDDFELDILAAIGRDIYWIEAKSGDYQQHVAKYSKFARFLGLDDEHSFMVLTDVPDERCEALSSLFSMTVCNLRTFEETLLAIVRADTAPQSMLVGNISAPELGG
ncbi:MAG: hypothetical protein N2Z76_05115 [Treponemataceae bacterium]|nr:hypothetical protein [Treponemataceae bacterium]